MRHFDGFFFRKEFGEIFNKADEDNDGGTTEAEQENSRSDVHCGRTEGVEHETSLRGECLERHKRCVKEL